MDFDQAAGELYGMVPTGFVARRKELADEARGAGDAALAKRIAELRRPSLSAWAVNLLRGEVDELLEVGAGLRAAWEGGEPLGEWERRRGPVVAALVRTVLGLAEQAGQALGPTAQREVEETLEAAVVDSEAADAVAEGRLVKPLSYAGFAVPSAPPSRAAPPAAKPRKKAEDPDAVRRRLEGEAVAAEKALAASQEALAEWQEQLEIVQGEHEAAANDEERLKLELDGARKRRETSEKRLRTSEREHAQAKRKVEAAQREASEARKRLTALD